MKERFGVVYIPVVPPTTGAGANPAGKIVDVYAKPYGFGEDPTDQSPEHIRDARQAHALDRDAIRLDWDRVAAPLRRAGLYRSGYAAAAAVRRLGLKKPAWAVYQTLYRQAYVDTLRLHPGVEATAGHIEGRSGELAMALALLLAASRSSSGLTIIATGQLGRPEGTRPEDADIEVSSVGKLPEKLRLIEQLAKTKNLPRGREHADPVWLFTPTAFNHHDGEPVAVAALPEVKQLKNWGITVIPVKTLGEAADYLKARRARWMWQDSAWLGGIAGGVVGLSLVLLHAMGWSEVRPRAPLPKTPPELAIVVGDGAQWLEKHYRALQSVDRVYPGQTLRLNFSQPAGEFRYFLKLDGSGKADIEDVEAHFGVGGPWEKSPPNTGFMDIQYEDRATDSAGAWTILLLVVERPWTEAQQRDLANRLASALAAKPELPSGIQYRLETNGCKPLPIQVDYVTRGPVARSTPPPEGAACLDWAHQLLKIINQQTQGKVRLAGYAFEVAPY